MIRGEMTGQDFIFLLNEELEKMKQPFFAAASKYVVQDIVSGIAAGADITGGDFPPLEQSTISIKEELYGHSQTLVAEGYLSRNDTYNIVNQFRLNKATISIKSIGTEPRDAVGWKLQERGIPSRRGIKYFRFFGISQDASDGIMEMISEMVDEAIRRAG